MVFMLNQELKLCSLETENLGVRVVLPSKGGATGRKGFGWFPETKDHQALLYFPPR